MPSSADRSLPYLLIERLPVQGLSELQAGNPGRLMILDAEPPPFFEAETLSGVHDLESRRSAFKRVIAPLAKRSKDSRDPFTLGRSRSNDLVLSFETVSRLHAMVAEFSPGEFRIYDNHSRNGVFVNRERLAPDRWYPLPAKASLKLGELDLSFLFGQEIAAP